MQQDWPSSVISQAFTLSGSDITFTDNSESLEQQSRQAFITPLPGLGVLDITGLDAEKFLQGQLSCDLRVISTENARRGVHCTPKGRTIASFVLASSAEQHYQCIVPSSCLPLLQQSLGKYIVFSRAELKDSSDQWVVFGLSGAASEPLIEAHFGAVPTAPLQQLCHEGALCINIEGAQPRYLLLLSRATAAGFWQTASERVQTADSAVWQLMDSKAGIANIDAATSEQFIPQMLNYDKLGAISFNKGCYTGQEVIARAHYKGAVKRRMQYFNASATQCPIPGSAVFKDGNNSGTVVSAVASDDNTIEGLVVVSQDNRLAELGPEYGAASLAITGLDYAE